MGATGWANPRRPMQRNKESAGCASVGETGLNKHKYVPFKSGLIKMKHVCYKKSNTKIQFKNIPQNIATPEQVAVNICWTLPPTPLCAYVQREDEGRLVQRHRDSANIRKMGPTIHKNSGLLFLLIEGKQMKPKELMNFLSIILRLP